VEYDVVVGNREWMKRSGLHVDADVDRTMTKLEVTGQTVVLCAINGNSLQSSFTALTLLVRHQERHYHDYRGNIDPFSRRRENLSQAARYSEALC